MSNVNSNSSARPIISNVALNNQGFINDEQSPPPSYSSIFPCQTDSNENYNSLKIYSITTTPEAIQINTQSSSVINTTLNAINLEPISYDELFQTSSANNLASGNSDCLRYNPINSQSSTLLLSSTSTASQNEILITNNLVKQIRIQFKRSYLISHFLFIILSSLTIITFQVILMSYNTRLSYLGCGIWAGLTNLGTLIVSIATIKYAKIWLLLTAIVLHVISMLFSLGSMIIINCIAATKYYICSSTFQSSSIELADEKLSICKFPAMRYINIGLILLGATCIIFFLNFFFKLVNVFNYMHSVPLTRSQSHQQQRQQYRT